MTHADLIAKLEAASEGSGTLDIEIARAVYGNDGQYREFTRSLDAALTLVPEGWRWQATNYDETSHAWAFMWEPGAPVAGASEGIASTTPLALCIAALRAREAGI